MDRQLLSSICEQVYRKFPETAGTQPKVTSRSENEFLLVFKVSVTTADGKSLPRIVRAVADASGKIIKLSTSR
jgi:hypothetical protein